MSILKKIFGGNQALKVCPRCLGKCHVDWADIKRLNQELRWIPGICAYCNGLGKVTNDIEKKVPVDASFLVINLSEDERKSIISGNFDALERGKQIDNQVEALINQIDHLHFKTGLTSIQVAKFLLDGQEELGGNDLQEFVNYVEKVIQKKALEN